MIINSFFIFSLLTFFMSLGFFLNKYLISLNFSDENSFFETLFYGVFTVTFLSVLFNFFVSLQNKVFLLVLLIIFVYSFFSFRNLIKKNIKKIFLLSIILSPLSTFIDFGYDAGLYHIPYQSIIQSDKINFGLANLHMRYGLTTSYSYIAAILWKGNFFNVVSAFSTILFSFFFIFIYEKIKNKNSLDNLFAISAIITFPLWYRYAELSISTVDIYFSIFFYFTFYYGVRVIFHSNKYDKELKKKIFLFLIFLSFTISTKPTAILLILFLFFVIIYKHKIFVQNFLEILKNNFISLIFLVFWILRSFIITSCLIYPIKLSCLKSSWQTNSVEAITFSIKAWNSIIFDSFLKFILNYELLIVIFILFLIILLMNFKKILNFLLLKRKLVFFVVSFLFVIITFYTEPLKFIHHLIQSDQNVLLKTIYIREIIFIFLFYTLGASFVLLTFKKDILFNKFSNLNFLNFLPFLFFILIFMIWISNSPNPRLGQNLFLLVIPVIFILVLDLKKVTIYDFSKYFNILIIFIIFKISIIQNLDQININSIIYLKKSVPDVKLEKRIFFGYLPQNSEHLCWTKKFCYPYGDVKIYNEVLNYKFFTEVKN